MLPPVPEDDDLRHRVAKAIYGNPSFWSYAAMSNPPIHIIVERGQVTLKGTVARTGGTYDGALAGNRAGRTVTE